MKLYIKLFIDLSENPFVYSLIFGKAKKAVGNGGDSFEFDTWGMPFREFYTVSRCRGACRARLKVRAEDSSEFFIDTDVMLHAAADLRHYPGADLEYLFSVRDESIRHYWSKSQITEYTPSDFFRDCIRDYEDYPECVLPAMSVFRAAQNKVEIGTAIEVEDKDSFDPSRLALLNATDSTGNPWIDTALAPDAFFIDTIVYDGVICEAYVDCDDAEGLSMLVETGTLMPSDRADLDLFDW